MFAEPLSGFRKATTRPRRTKYDWAQEVAHLLDTRYADDERITLVCDNLNTHTKGAFYEAFPPKQARDYVRRIDFVYTPKHGDWLNVAECELSCMTSQCLKDRRIGEIETLQTEIAGEWNRTRNRRRNDLVVHHIRFPSSLEWTGGGQQDKRFLLRGQRDPRPRERGNSHARATLLPGSRLQWGRGC